MSKARFLQHKKRFLRRFPKPESNPNLCYRGNCVMTIAEAHETAVFKMGAYDRLPLRARQKIANGDLLIQEDLDASRSS